MDELLSMGFSRELAMQALEATGGKSTVEATEWLLSNGPEVASGAAAEAAASTQGKTASPTKQQARLDCFFSAPSRVPLHSQAKQHENTKTRFVHPVEEHGPVVKFDACSRSLSEPPLKRKGQERDTEYHSTVPSCFPAAAKARSQFNHRDINKVPLAERMRPSSIDEIVGQDHLLGPGCSLRLLVESDAMVSMIFWGPPGTGKTSLARAIARSVSCRFVTASAITSGVKEVREILEEAKRSKTTGLRTLLFFDEVHRFNKAQQDVFLPYIEAGHVIFMGATIENPSFEVNAALLSRCKVLTLNKLQAQDIRQVLDRALTCSERGVIVPFMDDSLVQKIEIEEDAMHILSESADGDARVALNILEVAVASAVARKRKQNKVVHEDSVQSLPSLAMVDSQLENPVISRKTGMVRFSCSPNLSCESHSTVFEGEHQRPSKRSVRDRDMNTDDGRESEAQNMTDELQSNCLSLTVTDPKGSYLAMDQPSVMEKPNSNTIISVKVMDVSGSLQRSHVLYDKKGEEHYNIISALHKSMRGGDPDAALYWLSRMLEGGEGPLYIARRLIRFASEDIGLADSQAIMLAVACYQACHFLGMPECNVHLAHCVAYLALAPKSVAVYQAIESAQQHVKQGENEPVPLHLRNAPTGLMKQLGYGRGYIYPPNHEGLIKQEYMPPSLRGHKFLKWP